jgi:uncharacterized SAM-binding protein YcdF (DUF218 family)
MRNPLRLAWRWLVAATSALGFLFAVVTFLPVLEPWTIALCAPWTDTPGDTLIVLGAESVAGGILGLNSYWRSVNAVYEWRRGSYRDIVVSGSAGIAEQIRDFLVAQGVPVRSILLETASNNTREHALNIAEMLRRDPGRKVLLTSDYHSLRAYLAFRKCGLDVIPRPVPDAGKRATSLEQRWPVFIVLLTETVKLAGYRLRGWI